MNPPFPYIGEIFAVTTAIAWAFAVILFKKSGETVHPVALNLFKNVLAAILLVITTFIAGISLSQPGCSNFDYILLLFSGAIGIGIADSMTFKALNILSGSVYAIVDCLYSPIVIGLSILYLGESLNLTQSFGVLFIVAAVFTSTREKSEPLERKRIIVGIFWGVLALLLMGIGIVIAKPILERVPLLWATEIRMFGGLGTLVIVLLFTPSRRQILGTLKMATGWKYMIPGSFMGAYLSMIFWLAGMKFTSASIASALNQTSNIFIFVLAALILKERITLKHIIGIALAMAGVALVTFG